MCVIFIATFHELNILFHSVDIHSGHKIVIFQSKLFEFKDELFWTNINGFGFFFVSVSESIPK